MDSVKKRKIRWLTLAAAALLALLLMAALSPAAFAAGDAIDRAAAVQRLYELEGQPMVIQSVVFPRHENGILKISLIQPVVVDRDLRGSSAVQTVQKLGVGKKHALLIFVDLSWLPQPLPQPAYQEYAVCLSD